MHYILVVLSLFLRNRGLWRPASVFSMWCDVMSLRSFRTSIFFSESAQSPTKQINLSQRPHARRMRLLPFYACVCALLAAPCMFICLILPRWCVMFYTYKCAQLSVFVSGCQSLTEPVDKLYTNMPVCETPLFNRQRQVSSTGSLGYSNNQRCAIQCM